MKFEIEMLPKFLANKIGIDANGCWNCTVKSASNGYARVAQKRYMEKLRASK